MLNYFIFIYTNLNNFLHCLVIGISFTFYIQFNYLATAGTHLIKAVLD